MPAHSLTQVVVPECAAAMFSKSLTALITVWSGWSHRDKEGIIQASRGWLRDDDLGEHSWSKIFPSGSHGARRCGSRRFGRAVNWTETSTTCREVRLARTHLPRAHLFAFDKLQGIAVFQEVLPVLRIRQVLVNSARPECGPICYGYICTNTASSCAWRFHRRT